QLKVWPVKSNAGFLARALAHADFISGDVDTGFIDRRLDALVSAPAPSDAALQAAAGAFAAAHLDGDAPWAGLAGFRLNAPARLTVHLRRGEETYDLVLDA